ncbi:MAG: TIGR01777 family oxidoreductase [Terriglobia bacterium]
MTAHNLRILIAGGTGQVGRILARHLHDSSHLVTVIARNRASLPWKTVVWDGEHMGGWARELDSCDVLINLAGRSVNCRYSRAHRDEIRQSRLKSTRLLGKAIARSSKPPALWMNAATATIYRHSTDRAMDDRTGEIGGSEKNVPSTWKFSVDVARAWEREFFQSKTPHTRKVALRSAMIMSPDRAGVFDTLLRLVRFGLGGAAGSGKQYVSWIHDRDFVSAVDFLISQPDLKGAINLAAPDPLPNADFMRELRQAWGTRVGLPASRWMLEAGALLLRTETELILKSRRVMPRRLLDAGFRFEFPEWPEAARDLVKRWRAAR